MQAPLWLGGEFIGNYPTGGSRGYCRQMDTRRTLSENLRRLMDYAAGHDTGEPGSQNSLARKAEVSRGIIQRILIGDIATAIDTLEKIAQAYNLHAWQLLIGGLDPANPPVVPITDTERLLHERLRRVGDELKKHLDAAQESPHGRADRGAEPNRAHPAARAPQARSHATGSNKTPAARKPKSLARK